MGRGICSSRLRCLGREEEEEDREGEEDKHRTKEEDRDRDSYICLRRRLRNIHIRRGRCNNR